MGKKEVESERRIAFSVWVRKLGTRHLDALPGPSPKASKSFPWDQALEATPKRGECLGWVSRVRGGQPLNNPAPPKRCLGWEAANRLTNQHPRNEELGCRPNERIWGSRVFGT